MWIERKKAEYGYDEIKISILIDKFTKINTNEYFEEINNNKEKNKNIQTEILKTLIKGYLK